MQRAIGRAAPARLSLGACQQGAAGLSFGARETKLGWNSQPTTAVTLDGVRVPETARLAAEGDGFRIAMRARAPPSMMLPSCKHDHVSCPVYGMCRHESADRALAARQTFFSLRHSVMVTISSQLV